MTVSRLEDIQSGVANLDALIAEREAELVRRREVKASEIRKEIREFKRDRKALMAEGLAEVFPPGDARAAVLAGEVADADV